MSIINVNNTNNNNYGIFGSLRTEYQQKQEEVSLWNSEITDFAESSQSLISTLETQNSEQTTANNTVTSTQEAINNANTNLSSAQSALQDAMNIPVKEIQNEDGSITVDSSERDSAINIAQTLLNAAQEELETAIQENEEATNALEQIIEEIEETQASIDEIKNQQDNAETELSNAQSELYDIQEQIQQAEIEAEKSQQNEEQNNDENNPFALKESGETEEITEVTTEDTQALAENAKIIMSPELYTEEELKNAQAEVEEIAGKEYDSDNKQAAQFVNLAKNLSMKDIQTDETKQEEVKEDILELFKDINIESGVSEATANAIKLAFEEIGVSEDLDADGIGHNTGEMLKYGGAEGDAWCAGFVSWLYGSGQDRDNSSTFGYEIGVWELSQDAVNAGYYSDKSEYTPVAGDIMIQQNNGASHTGMVVKTDNEYVYTIEGNAGDKVRAKKYKLDGEGYQKISGYIRMNEWTGGSSSPVNIDYLSDELYEDADIDLNQSTR